MKKHRIVGVLWLGTLLGALSASGCAGAGKEAIHVRPGEMRDLSHVDLSKQPIIVEVREGEVVPLDVVVAGDLIASPEGATIPLTAKRAFFIRIDEKGVKLSVDGKTFDGKARVPGSF